MVTWLDALSRTREKIAGALSRAFSLGGRTDAASLEELETLLIQADVPAGLASAVVQGLKKAGGDALERTLAARLGNVEPFAWEKKDGPLSILVVGINGSGKTTTCAKLALLVKRAGLRPLLGAGDTFRAAGSDQLKIWASQIECDVVAGATGTDAAAVAFDAMAAAVARGADVLIMDTAGRMHTKAPLMQELQKVRRAMGKRLEGAPHETWMVLDASMGQNAIAQARLFNDAVPLTGVIVSKLDGSSKAGFLFSVREEIGVPIRFVGLGEGADDLAPFDAEAFVKALMGSKDQHG